MTDYATTQLGATNAVCVGLTKGECILVRIDAGHMPPGRGCTGTAEDDSNPQCITDDEELLIERWITDGQLP